MMIHEVQKIVFTLLATYTTLLTINNNSNNHHHLLLPIAHAQDITTATTNNNNNNNYTPEQCTQWISTALSVDALSSDKDGLTRSEFLTFLSNIPALQSYFNGNGDDYDYDNDESAATEITFDKLPFKVQLAYPTLACWCEELLLPSPSSSSSSIEGCCEGSNNPTIIVSALALPPIMEEYSNYYDNTNLENTTTNDTPMVRVSLEVRRAYRQEFCAFVHLAIMELSLSSSSDTTTAATTIATTTTTTTTTVSTDPITFIVHGSVIDYSTYPYTLIFDEEEKEEDESIETTPSTTTTTTTLPSYTTANDIRDNSESRQGVIGTLIQGFTRLSLDSLENCPVAVGSSSSSSSSGGGDTTITTTTTLPPGILGSLGETVVNDISKCFFVFVVIIVSSVRNDWVHSLHA